MGVCLHIFNTLIGESFVVVVEEFMVGVLVL